MFGRGPDTLNEMRDRQNMVKAQEREVQNFIQMTLQNLKQLWSDARDKAKKKNLLKAILGKLLAGMKNNAKGSTEAASDINAAGNAMADHGGSAKAK